MFKIVIIEDEKIAADNLSRMLKEVHPSCEIVAKIESVRDAVCILPTIEFDLIFMDIRLADGDAFEILEEIELAKPIIFSTAYDEYVLRAFKYLSIDYLLKPIGIKELEASLAKFEKHFLPHSDTEIDLTALQNLLKKDDGFKKRFLVQVGKKLKPFPVERICYFHSSNKMTFLTVEDDKSYPIDTSLTQLEKELDPNQFFRINRQYIISRTSIQHLYMVSPTKMKVVLKSDPGPDLFTSIDRMGRFRNWMK